VKSVSGRKTIDCPKCKGPLADGKPPGAAPRVDLKTEVFRAIVPERPPAPAAGSKQMQCQCMICDALFQAARDTTGRVKCPQCGSSFEPKE
jgi:DNA-directed RNA polymerase subunit RPC12/RpoP